MNNLETFCTLLKKLVPILRQINSLGGIAYLVGGTVRDIVLDRELKDFDIEVHKLSLEQLEECLKKFGKVKLVGKQFGVLRVSDFDIDWSIPRVDSKGRKPIVKFDPNMSIQQACKRRDLTMNAMVLDLTFATDSKTINYCYKKDFLISKMIDPYNGLVDIQQNKLRAVDEQLFLDDPLRFFRVMQFIGRFEMVPDIRLNNICKNMKLCDIVTQKPIARERIYEEIKKLFLKSRYPSLGFRWLLQIDRLKEIFPELYSLVGVKQRFIYHPEGDVFEHTMQALDASAVLSDYKNENEKFLIMLAVLSHDLGKVVTTDENLSCKGHEKAGVALAKTLLKKITNDQDIKKSVCKLVLYHIYPVVLFKQKANIKAYKKLALKLAPVTPRQLMLVCLADLRGRNPEKFVPLVKSDRENIFEEILNNFKLAKIEHGPEKPILLGRDLINYISPGPEMGKLLKKAYKIQIEEGIKDPKILLSRILK